MREAKDDEREGKRMRGQEGEGEAGRKNGDSD